MNQSKKMKQQHNPDDGLEESSFKEIINKFDEILKFMKDIEVFSSTWLFPCNIYLILFIFSAWAIS